MKCVEVYKELYHQEPFDVAFCPYRISPLGAHIDHLQHPFFQYLMEGHLKRCIYDLKVWNLYQSRYRKFQSFIKK